MQEVLKMFKIQLTEKDESAGNHVHVKKKKKENTLRFRDNIKKGLQCSFFFLPPLPVSVK